MLQAIRDRAQGWIAWVIVILITIPFALWGIQEYLGIGGPPVAASVNDHKITKREFEDTYRQYRANIKRRAGSDYRPELIDDELLRKEVLGAMISSDLTRQFATRLGMRVGDQVVQEFIRQQPAFQVDGQFDIERYELALQRQGMSEAEFVEQVRTAMLNEQLQRAISDSAILTTTELEENVRLRWQQRKIEYITIPAKHFTDKVLVEAAAIEEYYQQHQDSFMSPERVRLEYIELDIKNIAATLNADEETLRGYYEGHKNDYAPREQRRASHILIATTDDASADDIAVAREKAETALKRVQAGESFAAVAKELSQDPGSKDAGGDLDFFEAGVMDKSFEDAVFKLAKGEISGVVQTPFGFHIIKLTDIRPVVAPPFIEVQEQVKKDYLESEAVRLFYDYSTQVANLTYEEQDSLEPAAHALKIEVQKSEWITRDGGSGVLASPKVTAAAFSDDVLLDGRNSEIIELGAEHLLVLRAVEHEDASLKPLDKVQPEIEQQLRMQQASEKARERGQQLLGQLESGGKSLRQVASAEGVSLQQKDAVNRDNRELPIEIMRSLFRMPRPAEEKPVFAGVELESGDYAIIALQEITDGNMEGVTVQDRHNLLNALSERNGIGHISHLIENLRDSAKIEIDGATGQGTPE